jgi:hypothetical protein
MKNALDTLRRTHRDGPREVMAWRRSLVPDALLDEDSTTMERVSLREMLTSSPSIITDVRKPAALDTESIDDVPPPPPTEPEEHRVGQVGQTLDDFMFDEPERETTVMTALPKQDDTVDAMLTEQDHPALAPDDPER